MGKLINTNEHAVVVRDPDSVRDDGLTKVPPGPVEASGDLEKTLKSTGGVVSESSDEGKAWTAANEQPEPRPGAAGVGAHAEDLITQARRATGQALAALNQVVIGDDEAPLGPPSGTVTTKQAIVEGKPFEHPEKQGFADHEAVPGDLEGKAVTDVARAQAEDTASVDELAQELLERTEDDEAPVGSSARGGRSDTRSAAHDRGDIGAPGRTVQGDKPSSDKE